MILSRKHRFVFVKGIKVGGTSAEIALSQICGSEDIVTPVTPADERHRLGTNGEPRNYAAHFYHPWLRKRIEDRYTRHVKSASADRLASLKLPRSHFYNHMPFSRVLQLVPEATTYELLFVERSPYAKVLSLANWYLNEGAYRRGQQESSSASELAREVDRLIEDNGLVKVLNIDRYRDLDGRIRAMPWRTQELGRKIDDFLASRGLPPVSLVNAKVGLQSERVDPEAIFEPRQVAIINERFAEEFATFGWPMIKP